MKVLNSELAGSMLPPAASERFAEHEPGPQLRAALWPGTTAVHPEDGTPSVKSYLSSASTCSVRAIIAQRRDACARVTPSVAALSCWASDWNWVARVGDG